MSFRKELEEDTVRSLPIREAILIDSHTLVRGAIARMRDHALGCAVIVDHDQAPLGVFTEHSVIQVLNQEACLDDSPVGNFADPDFFCVAETDPITKVWDLIQQSAARFICVTDPSGKVLGITGQRGLAEYIADCFAQQVTVQRLGSTPWMQSREGA